MPLPHNSNSPSGTQDSRFKIILVSILGIVGAFFIGSWLPGANPRTILYAATVAALIIYSFFLSHFALHFALLAISLDPEMRTFGFSMKTPELVGAILGPVFLLNLWRKDLLSTPQLVTKSREFRFLFFIVLFYLGTHCWYNWRAPYYPFSFANAGKVYFGMIFPFFLIFWFLIKPPSLHLPKRPLTITAIALLSGLTMNLAIRIYATYILGYGTSEFDSAAEFTKSAIYIPILNLTENQYALRILAPFAALFATVALTANTPESKRTLSKLIFILLLILSLLGAAISMGRATVIFTVALPSIVLIWRKQVAFLVAFSMFAVFALAIIRIVYEAEPEAVPMSIQRAVALIPGMAMDDSARGNISGSSDWRYKLFEMGIKEWQSHPRIFWFGRSTSAVTSADIAQFVNFKESMMLDMSLRRGSTHNLITDLLVNVGLVGLILYLLLWVSAIFLLFRLTRISLPETPERQFFFSASIFAPFQLIYALIGGSWFPVQASILVVIGILLLLLRSRGESKRENPPLRGPTSLNQNLNQSPST